MNTLDKSMDLTSSSRVTTLSWMEQLRMVTVCRVDIVLLNDAHLVVVATPFAIVKGISFPLMVTIACL